MHFLSLPDPALTSVFKKLGGDIFSDDNVEDSTDARNLAICCTRLNLIYRKCVQNVSLNKFYSPSQCGRILLRYPSINDLSLDLSIVPNLRASDAPRHGSARTWSASPTAYPLCLITSRLKWLRLADGWMHVRHLQAVIEKCSNLEMLDLADCRVYLDRDCDVYTDETCSFSLERHASSLKELFVDFSRKWIETSNPVIDIRWLALFSLSALTHVHISGAKWDSNSFRQLANAVNLKSLSLDQIPVSDADLEAVLPALPQLRLVALRCCKNLSFRTLAWLPQTLDILDVSLTSAILQFPAGRSRASDDGKKTVKELIADGVKEPSFGYFLEVYAGHSLESVILPFCEWRTASELLYLLERAKGLKRLDLRDGRGIDYEDSETITYITGLPCHMRTNDGHALFM